MPQDLKMPWQFAGRKFNVEHWNRSLGAQRPLEPVLTGSSSSHRKDIGDRTAGSIPAESGVNLPLAGGLPRTTDVVAPFGCS